MSIHERCTEILKCIQSIAPNLQPKIIPKGYDDSNLFSFCDKEEQKEELESLISRYNKSYTSCFACQKSCSKDELIFCTLWDIDVENKVYKLSKLVFYCKLCESIHNLETFLKTSFEHEVMETTINHFALVNGLEGSIASKTINFEQCISLAYSLKIILGNIKNFKVVDHNNNLMSEIQSFKPLFEDLMGKDLSSNNDMKSSKKKRSLPSNENKENSKKKKRKSIK